MDPVSPEWELVISAEEDMLWSDAWLLLACIYAAREKPASLEDVIAAADYIQHAIVTFEEMEGDLARLTAKGLLTVSDHGLAPGDKALVFYRSTTKLGRKVDEAEEDLRKFIGARPSSPEQRPQHANAGVSLPSLTRAKFDAAVAAHLGRHPRLTGVKRKC